MVPLIKGPSCDLLGSPAKKVVLLQSGTGTLVSFLCGPITLQTSSHTDNQGGSYSVSNHCTLLFNS